MTPAEQQALADAVAAEHGAVYAYGVVAAFVLAERSDAVTAAAAAHAGRRDTVTGALTADGAAAPLPAPGYALPLVVTDATTAVALAAAVEDATAQAWRSVLERSDPVLEGSDPVLEGSDPVPEGSDPVPEGSDPAAAGVADGALDVRTTAVSALTDCAVRAAGWRLVLGAAPATTAFPGRPDPVGG